MNIRVKVLVSLISALALAGILFYFLTDKKVETSAEFFDEIEQCQLPTILKTTEHFGFPRPEKAAKSTGTLKALVLFVDFTDVPFSEQALSEWRLNQIPTFEEAISRMSYGKLNYKVDIHTEVVHINKSAAAYNMDVTHFSAPEKKQSADFMSLIKDTAKIADPVVDFSQYEFFNIVAPPTGKIEMNGTTGPFRMKLDNHVIDYATFGSINEYFQNPAKKIWLLHESGHTMGLIHPYAYSQMWSAMGSGDTNAPEFLGWERFLLNWFDPSNLVCIANPKLDTYNVEISPLYKADSDTKMLVYKLDESSAIVIENRGEKEFGKVDSSQSGVLIYKVQTNVPSDFGAVSLLFGNVSRPSGTIKAGEFVNYEDLEIKVHDLNDKGAFVSIGKKQ